MNTVLITGSAGFIGFHLAQVLLAAGHKVVGIDVMSDYYDVALKQRRHQILLQNEGFACIEADIEDMETLSAFCDLHQPNIIVHLGGQAGVRYSLDNPRAYINTNVVGTFNVMECAKTLGVDHLLMASTSSVYGANTEMPDADTHQADLPMTIYAATKKANEAMGHSYAHLYDLPTTMFRFFTVYGPWGRPDMALFKFTKGILAGDPIDIYNHGEMFRDFTYVEDLVRGISGLIDTAPVRPASADDIAEGDSLSPVAPYRIVNIGNSDKVRLMDFVEAIEAEIGIPAKRNYMDIQPGDVPATWANADLLHSLTGYKPNTNIREGVGKFVSWYRDYYNV
jgi:UDP-glucuronate 4-epimerase